MQRLFNYNVGPSQWTAYFFIVFTQIGTVFFSIRTSYLVRCDTNHWNHHLIRTVFTDQNQMSSFRPMPCFCFCLFFFKYRNYGSIPSQPPPKGEIITELDLFTSLYLLSNLQGQSTVSFNRAACSCKPSQLWQSMQVNACQAGNSAGLCSSSLPYSYRILPFTST